MNELLSMQREILELNKRVLELYEQNCAFHAHFATVSAASSSAQMDVLRAMSMALAAVESILADHPRKAEIFESMQAATTAPDVQLQLNELASRLQPK